MGAADLLPPAANRLDREGRRVVGDADAHPTGIAGEIVNAIGDRPPQFLDQEVVDPHLFRLALATPLASGILEVADEFLFLGVDRDHCLAFGQGGADLGVDVGELGIAIWMAVALSGLAVGLKAELLLPQQFAHDRMAHAMPQGGEFGRHPAQLFRATATSDRRAPRARPARSSRREASGPSQPALCGRRPNGGRGPAPTASAPRVHSGRGRWCLRRCR